MVLNDHKLSATVIFDDTGKTIQLSTKQNSECLFFDKFTVGDDDIQLRLDFTEKGIDPETGHPTLDADFYNSQTGKKRKLKGERLTAHHTNTKPGEPRCYEWSFKETQHKIRVMITFHAGICESLKFNDRFDATITKASNPKH